MAKIKLVAVAKDESAYLPEWIFHHFYFGFDAIDIYINRTQDNSLDALEKIQKIHKNLNFYVADWIDLCLDKTVRSQLQNIIYAKSYYEEKSKQTYTHIMFLDIDEFWTPLDLNTNINHFIDKFQKHSSISFQWFNISGEEKQFSYLEKEMNGRYNSHVKTLINSSTFVRY